MTMKKDFFEPIHQVGNQVEATPSDQAWSRLEKKLDRDQEVRRKKRREIFNLNIYWIAATIIGILAITSISVFIIKNKQDHTLASLPNVRSEIKEVAAEITESSSSTKADLQPTSSTNVEAVKSSDTERFAKGRSASDEASRKKSSKVMEQQSAAKLLANAEEQPASDEANAGAPTATIQAPRAAEEGLSKTPPPAGKMKAAAMDDTELKEDSGFYGVWLDDQGRVVIEMTNQRLLFEGKAATKRSSTRGGSLDFQLQNRKWNLSLLGGSKLELSEVGLPSGKVNRRILHRK